MDHHLLFCLTLLIYLMFITIIYFLDLFLIYNNFINHYMYLVMLLILANLNENNFHHPRYNCYHQLFQSLNLIKAILSLYCLLYWK